MVPDFVVGTAGGGVTRFPLRPKDRRPSLSWLDETRTTIQDTPGRLDSGGSSRSPARYTGWGAMVGRPRLLCSAAGVRRAFPESGGVRPLPSGPSFVRTAKWGSTMTFRTTSYALTPGLGRVRARLGGDFLDGTQPSTLGEPGTPSGDAQPRPESDLATLANEAIAEAGLYGWRTGDMRALLRRELEASVAAMSARWSAGLAGRTRQRSHEWSAPVFSQWLLDSRPTVESSAARVIEQVRGSGPLVIPRAHDDLRSVKGNPKRGVTRVEILFNPLLESTDAPLGGQEIGRFLEALQVLLESHGSMCIAEVRAVPIVLALLALRELVACAEDTTLEAAALQDAETQAQTIAMGRSASASQDQDGRLFDVGDDHSAPSSFWAHLGVRLFELNALGVAENALWETRIRRELMIDETVPWDATRQTLAARRDAIYRRAVRLVTTVEALSLLTGDALLQGHGEVEQILRQDASGAYQRMDLSSKRLYWREVEELARYSPSSERDVCEVAVQRCFKAMDVDCSNIARGHVGYYLVGEGRLALEQELGYRRFGFGRLARWHECAPAVLPTIAALVLSVSGLVALCAYGLSQGASVGGVVVLALGSALPIGELSYSMVAGFARGGSSPLRACRFDPTLPLSESDRTLVVLLSSGSRTLDASDVARWLETAYLANRDPNVSFAAVRESGMPAGAKDADDQRCLEADVRAIAALNEHYRAEHGPGPFLLLVHSRTTHGPSISTDGADRDATIIDLISFLRGRSDSRTQEIVGGPLGKVAFLVAVDDCVVLPLRSVNKMVSTLAHPLNRGCRDPSQGRPTGGWWLAAPRVSASNLSSGASRFASMNASLSRRGLGLTAHGSFCFGVTQTHVEVIDVVASDDAFEPDSQLPAERRSQGVTGDILWAPPLPDVEVVAAPSSSYLAAVGQSRRRILRMRRAAGSGVLRTLGLGGSSLRLGNHRRVAAVAGDWAAAILPLNLLILLMIGAFVPIGLGWPVIVEAVAVLFAPVLVDLLGFPVSALGRSGSRESVRLRDTVLDVRLNLFRMCVLPHLAFESTCAMVGVRSGASTASNVSAKEARAEAGGSGVLSLAGHYRLMAAPVLLASLILLASVLHQSKAPLLISSGLAVLWLLSPALALLVSRPSAPLAPEIGGDQRFFLRRVARKTWRFFDTFVVAHGHGLVPDNYQEDPTAGVAWRTSPTNVGLQLLSYVNGYDLGYTTVSGLVDRVEAALDTLVGLERFRGHFFNSYSINTLQPLRPIRVSTVDSGNIAAHLLVLRIALLEISEAPLVGAQLVDGTRDATRLALEDLVACQNELAPAEVVRSMRDALDGMVRTIDTAEAPRDLGEWWALFKRLELFASEARRLLGELEQTHERIPVGAQIVAGAGVDLGVPATPFERLSASICDVGSAVAEPLALLGRYAPWAPLVGDAPASARLDAALGPLLAHSPSLAGLAEGLVHALETLDRLAAGHDELAVEGAAAEAGTSAWAAEVAANIRDARPYAIELLARLSLSADLAREMWEHADLSMLYDTDLQLFSTGYNLSEGRLEASYHDLLASECRLASFLAIAKGDVPQEHWFRLSRGLTQTPEGRALVSWSASMSEYLAPLLVMRDRPGTLLAETYSTVVRAQIAYGRARGVPWGVSEAGYNARDASSAQLTQEFGIPGLGLKRGLSQDVVVAPYAALLALPVAPREVLADLAAFTSEGAEGRYGYYEALDYTAGRVPVGKTRAVVKSYSAHHQGGGFVALGNALLGGKMSERFHASPMVVSAEQLLEERVPRNVQLVSPHIEEVENVRSVREILPPVKRRYITAETLVPATHFLSNGRYSVMVTNGGGGYSRWQGVAINRYHEDVTRDCWGQFFYIRDTDSGVVFSAPHSPCPSMPDSYDVIFAPDKAEYRRSDGGLETYVEVSVSPEDDVEIRRLTITNHGQMARHLEATSFFEIALSRRAADQAHRSSPSLLVETDRLTGFDAILFARRPCGENDQAVWGLHVLASGQDGGDVSHETDRVAFIGRLLGVDRPAALNTSGSLGNTTGPVADPCCSLRRGFAVPPGESVRLVFTTGVAETRDDAARLAEKYSDIESAQRALDLAWTAAQLELRDLGISPQEAITLERLASRLVFTDPYSPMKLGDAELAVPMSRLADVGLSGDNPMIIVRVTEAEHAALVREVLLAQQYWRHRGLIADLVIWRCGSGPGDDELDDRIGRVLESCDALKWIAEPGGVFLVREVESSPEVLNLLMTMARLVVDGGGGSLEFQLNRWRDRPQQPESLEPSRLRIAWPSRPFRPPALAYADEHGGFCFGPDEYVVVVNGGGAAHPPVTNVLANPEGFGALVTEAGCSCSWALDSNQNLLTAWDDDPVSQGVGEALYIRDEETGEFWSPTPLPVMSEGSPYVVRHGHGYTRYEHETSGIQQTLDWFVAIDEPVRICTLRLGNLTPEPRKLTVTHYVEWVLGQSRSEAQNRVVTRFDQDASMMTARNNLNGEFAGLTAFLASDRAVQSHTGSRTDFLGRCGRPADPSAMHLKSLGNQTGQYHDSCGALMTEVEIPAGGVAEVSFLLGQSGTPDAARRIVDRYRQDGAVAEGFESVRQFWALASPIITIDTPQSDLDLVINQLLPYQGTALLLANPPFMRTEREHRLMLQALALIKGAPEAARSRLLRAGSAVDAAHNFGPASDVGEVPPVVALMAVLCCYCSVTGDVRILEAPVIWENSGPDELSVRRAPAESFSEMCRRVHEAGDAQAEPRLGSGHVAGDRRKTQLVASVENRFLELCEASRIAVQDRPTNQSSAPGLRARREDRDRPGPHGGAALRDECLAIWALASVLGRGTDWFDFGDHTASEAGDEASSLGSPLDSGENDAMVAEHAAHECGTLLAFATTLAGWLDLGRVDDVLCGLDELGLGAPDSSHPSCNPWISTPPWVTRGSQLDEDGGIMNGGSAITADYPLGSLLLSATIVKGLSGVDFDGAGRVVCLDEPELPLPWEGCGAVVRVDGSHRRVNISRASDFTGLPGDVLFDSPGLVVSTHVLLDGFTAPSSSPGMDLERKEHRA